MRMAIQTGTMVVIGALMCVFCMNGYAHAGEHGWAPHRKGGRPPNPIEEIIAELDLSDEQKAQIDAFHTRQETEMKDGFETVRKTHEAMRAELDKYEHDPAVIEGIIETLTVQHRKMLEHRVAGITAIKGILTKEQFKQLQERMQIKHEEMRKKMERGMRKKGGPDGPPPPMF